MEAKNKEDNLCDKCLNSENFSSCFDVWSVEFDSDETLNIIKCESYKEVTY
jgi:hypothetical protein